MAGPYRIGHGHGDAMVCTSATYGRERVSIIHSMYASFTSDVRVSKIWTFTNYVDLAIRSEN